MDKFFSVDKSAKLVDILEFYTLSAALKKAIFKPKFRQDRVAHVNIEDIKQELGLRHKELAKRLNVSVRTLYYWRAGAYEAPPRAQEHLRDLLKLKRAGLLDYEPSPRRKRTLKYSTAFNSFYNG